jgi:hypothetical protein
VELTATVYTGAGMHAVWDVDEFSWIKDYNSWSDQLEDESDLRRHIAAGHLVPVNIGSDGTFCLRVVGDEAAMPEPSTGQLRRTLVTSEPYRLRSTGRIAVSGIEFVAVPDAKVHVADLPAGDYDVCVRLLNYDDVAEKTDEHPDFLITIGPAQAASPRLEIATFDP